MHGCIYFKDDLRSLGEEPEEVNIQSATASIPDIFAIGPLTNEDVDLHSKEEENITSVGKLLTLFRDESVLPADAQKNSRKFKDIFIGLAKDDEEKELFTRLWPYQEPADTEGL
ncbi:unnamed protein product [Penicillium discolor]